MKKQFLLFGAFALVLGCSAWYVTSTDNIGTFKLEGKKKEGHTPAEKAQRAKEAMEHRFNRLKDENGNFNDAYYAKAIAQANQLLQSGSRAGALNLQWEELGPDNVGGRTRAILIDKRDPTRNTVYAGGVAGGLWKSTDGTNTWSLVSNWNGSLAISCIAQSVSGKIYVGTGEGLAQIGGTSLNSGSMGNGIYMLDANDNAIQVSPSAFDGTTMDPSSPWAAVNRIAIDPNNELHMLAATQKGLYETNDAGVNWSLITISNIGSTQSVADVKWSTDGVNIYAAAGGNNKLVRSRNGGFTWERVPATNPGMPTVAGRMEIAVAPTDGNVVYLAVSTTQGCTVGVYRSGDGGETWATIGTKGPLFDPFGDQCQGWYDNVIAVSPADPNKVYMGGVDFYTWSDQTGWKLADVGLGGEDTNPNYIHPDKHAITIDETNPNVMYVGCDGGVYKSTNAVSAFPFPSYTVKNRGFNVTQFYSIGAGLTGEVLGGTQDNGTQYINYKGNTRMAAKRVIGGDGIYSEISHIDPKIMFGGIYFGEVRRSGNGGGSFDGFFDKKIDRRSEGQPSGCGGALNGNAPFITPFYLTETRNAANGLLTSTFNMYDRDYTAGEVVQVTSNTGATFSYVLPSDYPKGSSINVPDPIRSKVLVTSSCGVWITPDALELGNTPRWFKLAININGIAQSYSATADGDILYIGTSAGRVYKFTDLNARCDTTTYTISTNANNIVVDNLYKTTGQYTNTVVASGRPIEGICVDPTNPDHIVAVVAGFSATNQPHVYESTNGGTTWAPLGTGLPNMPVYDVVVRDANTVIIASELGMWSWDGTSWHEENNVMPRVPAYRFIEKSLYQDACKVLYVGTHGRGMWRSTTLTAAGCNLVSSIDKELANTPDVSGLNIFPNPVNEGSKIAITVDRSTDVVFRVFDMTGKLYREVTARNLVAGENLFDLNAAGLGAGTYVLTATAGTQRTQSRLFTVSK